MNVEYLYFSTWLILLIHLFVTHHQHYQQTMKLLTNYSLATYIHIHENIVMYNIGFCSSKAAG